MRRREVLLAAAACALPATAAQPSFAARLDALEAELDGRIGVFAVRGQRTLAWRHTERFAYASVFKWLLAAAVLDAVQAKRLALEDRLVFSEKDLLEPSTLTKPNVGKGMTVAELCKAAVTVSDNTATDQLEKRLGGIEALRSFARRLGDTTTRFDRLEPELNTNLPGDARDTSTPEAMARLLEAAFSRDVLSDASKQQLFAWMQATTTGLQRIRAATPADWSAGDKTGTSGNGAVNDVAVLRPPKGAPLYVCVFTNAKRHDMELGARVIAEAARAVLATPGMSEP